MWLTCDGTTTTLNEMKIIHRSMKWPCDWNRPLSKEEREIAKRLQCAPERTDYRLGEVLQAESVELPDERPASGSGVGRGEDAFGGVERTWSDRQRGSG